MVVGNANNKFHAYLYNGTAFVYDKAYNDSSSVVYKVDITGDG